MLVKYWRDWSASCKTAPGKYKTSAVNREKLMWFIHVLQHTCLNQRVTEIIDEGGVISIKYNKIIDLIYEKLLPTFGPIFLTLQPSFKFHYHLLNNIWTKNIEKD